MNQNQQTEKYQTLKSLLEIDEDALDWLFVLPLISYDTIQVGINP